MREFIERLIESFFELVGENAITVYNEYCLQFELATFLRENLLPEYPNHSVQIERNLEHFGIENVVAEREEGFKNFGVAHNNFPKKRIDIVILKIEDQEIVEKICAIELKYPNNGQHPQQMYKFCEDVCFVESLVHIGGFKFGFTITYTDDQRFVDEGNTLDGVYGYFRTLNNNVPIIPNEINNNYLHRSYHLENEYNINWTDVGASKKYLLAIN